jgi:hypothetical protein
MEYDKIWIGKKVFVKLKNSTRAYSGIVLNETPDTIIIRDIINHLVSINKSEIAILQEEK